MITLLDIFPKLKKQTKKRLNKTQQKIKKIEPISGGGKQNKKFSKNNKKFVKDFTAAGFAILK